MELIRQYSGLKRENYILFFGRMVTNLGAMVWPILTLILNRKLGFSAQESAGLIILVGAVCLPANLIGGHLADRFDQRRLIIGLDLLSVAMYLFCSLTPLSPLSLIPITAAAACQMAEGPIYQAMIADITPPEKQHQAFSLLYLGGNIGLILAPVLAGFLLNRYLWLCFLISGLSIGLSSLLIAAGIRPRTPRLSGTRGGADPFGAEAAGANTSDTDRSGANTADANLSGTGTADAAASDTDAAATSAVRVSFSAVIQATPVLVLFLLMHGIYQGAYTQFCYLIPLDLSAMHGADGPAIYGTVTSFNCALVVLCTPVITRLFAGKSDPMKFVLANLLQVASFVLFRLSPGRIPAYYLAMAVFTAGEIFSSISVGPYLAGTAPAAYRGRIYGIAAFAGALMAGVTQWYSGYYLDTFGRNQSWAFSIGIAAAALLPAVLLWLRQSRRPSADSPRHPPVTPPTDAADSSRRPPANTDGRR